MMMMMYKGKRRKPKSEKMKYHIHIFLWAMTLSTCWTILHANVVVTESNSSTSTNTTLLEQTLPILSSKSQTHDESDLYTRPIMNARTGEIEGDESETHIDLDILELYGSGSKDQHRSFHSPGLESTDSESSCSSNAIVTTVSSSSSSSNDEYTSNRGEHILVIATLDGAFFGLDRNTGKIIWTQSHSLPLSPQADQQKHSQTADTFTSSSSFTASTPRHSSNGRQFFMPMVSTTTTTRSYTQKTKASSSSSPFDASILAIPSIDGRVFLTPFAKEDEEYYHKLWRTLQPSSTSSTKDDSSTWHPTSSTKKNKRNKKNILWIPNKDWTLSSMTRDIVNHSPFFDSQGRLYIGSSTTMTAALDRNTGEIVHIFPENQQQHPTSTSTENKTEGKKNETESSNEYTSETLEIKTRNLIWIGREDYTVSVFHPPSLQEDVRFSTSQLSSITDMFQEMDPTIRHKDQNSDDDKSLEIFIPPPVSRKSPRSKGLRFRGKNHHPNLESAGTFLNNKDSENPQYQQHLLLPRSNNHHDTRIEQSLMQHTDSSPFIPGSIISTPEGQLTMYHPETGQLLWMTEEPFTSPVVFAMDAYSGHSLFVDILTDVPLENNKPDDAAIVGALSSGQLFAIPLFPMEEEEDGDSKLHALQRLPRFISSKATYASSLSSTAASTITTTSGNIAVWSPDTKTVVRQDDSFYPTYDASVRNTIASMSPICNPSMSTFPQCLYHLTGSENDSKQMDIPFHSNVEWMNLLAAGYSPPDVWFLKQRMQEEEENRSRNSRYNLLLRFLLSWIPPVVTLTLVISFELARRKREQRRKQNSEADYADSNVDTRALKRRFSTVSSSHENNVPSLVLETSTDTQEDSLSRLIYVSDTILGYGGHGTVVFKGSLAGRHVAVKRMLKNYHASADREISLLIESDGHPNVVRYFFKEIRGDFVYLALEMCNASLQDLITSVQRKVSIQAYEPQVVAYATRKILFHIALGVRHLHELRIVHRDLKPANILLAHKTREDSFFEPNSDDGMDQLYRAFINDQYLPKISDMGLGKQLSSQSSYGVSVRGGLTEASTIGGAGPGSVGWQAPEIMARRSTDIPLRNVEYSSDSKEGSPILESSVNTRTSRSVDIFSLGCVFYSALLPGSHPFGEWYEREANIMKNRPELSSLEDTSIDAFDLVSWMIQREAKSRPTACQVCEHPYFWDSVKRSSFLCDFSDRLEAESLLANNNSSPSFDILAIERSAQKIVGDAWNLKVDQDLLSHLSKYRSYDPSSVRDCLRMIRNKHHHFDEIPIELRQRMFHGSESLQGYFESKFPRLVQHCYSFCRQHLMPDDPLANKYRIPSKKSITDTQTIREKTNAVKEIDDKKDQHSPLSLILSCKKDPSDDLIIWEGSSAAKSYNCRGWIRSQEVWILGSDTKRDVYIAKCLEDPKFRTRLCNHWDTSQGISCPMRKKYKCIFAHGPVELRVKEGKRDRWGKLCDKNGNNSNPCHSGGEDTYGAAKLIENTRSGQGKVKL